MSKALLEADKLRQERMNEQLWLQGLYVFDAVSCAVHNGNRAKKSDPVLKYPERPYDIFSKKGKENVIDDGMTKEERELLIAKIMLDNERRASKKNWGGT